MSASRLLRDAGLALFSSSSSLSLFLRPSAAATTPRPAGPCHVCCDAAAPARRAPRQKSRRLLTTLARTQTPVNMSRPQVGIDRLPQRRLSTEPREAMNCKSCRKRKVPPHHSACRRRELTLFSEDQVQPLASHVRGLQGLRVPVYLWFVLAPIPHSDRPIASRPTINADHL